MQWQAREGPGWGIIFPPGESCQSRGLVKKYGLRLDFALLGYEMQFPSLLAKLDATSRRRRVCFDTYAPKRLHSGDYSFLGHALLSYFLIILVQLTAKRLRIFLWARNKICLLTLLSFQGFKCVFTKNNLHHDQTYFDIHMNAFFKKLVRIALSKKHQNSGEKFSGHARERGARNITQNKTDVAVNN